MLNGHSGGDFLVDLTHRWAEALASKGEGLDTAKAFDMIWHGHFYRNHQHTKSPKDSASRSLAFWMNGALRSSLTAAAPTPRPSMRALLRFGDLPYDVHAAH